MGNLTWPDTIVYAMLLISVSIFATQLTTYGFKGTCLQQPISNKTMTTVVIMSIVLIAYKQYLEINEILPNRLYIALCTLVLPTIWGIFYRYCILSPGIAELNRANIILKFLIRNYYQPGQRNVDQEKELNKSRLVTSAIKLYTMAAEQQKGKITTHLILRIIELNEHNNTDIIMFDCLQCSNHLSIDIYSYPLANMFCPICNHLSMIERINKNIFIFNEDVRKITDQNLKNIVMTYTSRAIIARIIGATTYSNQLLVKAEKIILFLLEKNPTDYECNSILVAIIFQKAENEHVRGGLTKARTNYEECIELCKKVDQTHTSETAQRLLKELS